MKTTLLSLKAFFTICLLCLVGGVNVMAQDTETVDFTKQGYTDKNEVSTYSGTNFQIAFSKGSYSSLPKYFKTGTAIRFYSGNTITFSSTTKKIKEITFTYGNDTDNGYGCSSGSYSINEKKWTSASEDGVAEVTLTNTNSGQYRLRQVTVTFVGGSTTPGTETPAPTITPASKTFSESFEAIISCTDAAAKIYYTLDGKTPDATSKLYTTGVTISEATTTLKAVAIKNGKASKVAEAVYTYVAPVAPVAPTYTYTIWSEDWSTFLETEEEQPKSGTNSTYKYGDKTTETTDTKLYFGKSDNYAGGEVPELLIKQNQSFFINVTSLKGCSGTLHFSFITNKKSFTIESTTTDVKVGAPTIEGDKYTYAITVPKGTEGLNIEIKNTGKNMRVDNLSLSAKLKDLGTGSFTITSARYGTYYTEDAFVMPEGVTGYTITDKNGESLSLNAAYPANEVVPAKTALLLKADEELAANKDFTYTIVNSEEVAPEGNLLHGSVEATKTQVEGATAYYKLAKGEEGIGFYWANENGGAFINGANKAYLAVTTGSLSQMRGFSFESMTTNINNVVANTNNSKNAVIYDLNGRRVNSLNAAKGVYIVNGKKVIVK